MTLPTINVPTYELEIPSSKEKLTYRPFLVKEEKILLLAMEQDNENEMLAAVRQIIANCTYDKINIENLALFDLEYIFLRIRAKSVGEISKLQLLCEDDGETYAEVEVNLEDVQVNFQDKHTNNITLSDDISLIMEYPQFNVVGLKEGDSETKYVFKLIKQSISQIIDGETIHERVDFSDKELDTFLESLTTEHFKDVQNFFETMPKLQHEVKFKNPKTKKQNKVTLEGLNSFFV